jgi:microcompartment protein CcmL/EutN
MASEKLGIALGMIETRGLVPAIEAADAFVIASAAVTLPYSCAVKPVP